MSPPIPACRRIPAPGRVLHENEWSFLTHSWFGLKFCHLALCRQRANLQGVFRTAAAMTDKVDHHQNGYSELDGRCRSGQQIGRSILYLSLRLQTRKDKPPEYHRPLHPSGPKRRFYLRRYCYLSFRVFLNYNLQRAKINKGILSIFSFIFILHFLVFQYRFHTYSKTKACSAGDHQEQGAVTVQIEKNFLSVGTKKGVHA